MTKDDITRMAREAGCLKPQVRGISSPEQSKQLMELRSEHDSRTICN